MAILVGCNADSTETTETSCSGDVGCAELSTVRLTLLDIRYDLAQPVYVNNRIPVHFGLTAESPDPAAPVTQQVAVSFSLVDANPEYPNDPGGCASSALNVELLGDGKEHVFDGFIWPTTLCGDLAGKTVNVHVAFDGGDEVETGVKAPSVLFNEATRGDELNQQCRKDETATAGDGCVYAIALEATPTDGNSPLIDVRVAGVTPSSSVALLALPKTNAQPLPLLSVQSVLVVNGRDPYISGTPADAVPPGLEALVPGITEELRFGADESDIDALTRLPGEASLAYELTPKGKEEWLPLAIGADRVAGAPIEQLMPGTPNVFDHDLFAEGETRDALSGAWTDITEFTVRGCFEAAFTQAGNAGDGNASDCRVFDVVLVREESATSAALSFQFNKELSKKVGNDRINLEAYFGTTNRLDKSGVTSSVEGRVTVAGKLGKSFDVNVVRAFGNAHLGTDSASTGYELGVEVFDQNVLSVEKADASLVDEREFSKAKSFKVAGLGFGFGPVQVGISVELGGEVFLTTSDHLTAIADGAKCSELLGVVDALPACGELSRTIEPGFAFTADVFGGIDIKIVKAGVSAELKMVETTFPLTGSLAFGLTDGGGVLVKGKMLWERTLTLIKGSVDIVGSVGIKWFKKTFKVHLFSFSSNKETATLLEETMGNVEELN